MTDIFNTYRTAYRFSLSELPYQDLLCGRRDAIVVPAGDWEWRRRPPRCFDWVILQNREDFRVIPSEVVWTDRRSILTLTHPHLKRLGYAPNETGRQAFLSRNEAIYPDLPSNENPKIHFILLRGLTPAELQRYEEEKAS